MLIMRGFEVHTGKTFSNNSSSNSNNSNYCDYQTIVNIIDSLL